jgi:hypothetical protein
VVLGEVALDLLPDLALPAGELEGQPGVEGREQSTASRACPGPELPLLGTSAGQHELGDEGLLEAEPLLGRADLLVVVGTVDPSQE